MVTDDCGSGPWPLPVCFDPDDTGSTVCTRDFYQWRDLWQLSSWQAKGRLQRLRNAGKAKRHGWIWTLDEDAASDFPRERK